MAHTYILSPWVICAKNHHPAAALLGYLRKKLVPLRGSRWGSPGVVPAKNAQNTPPWDSGTTGTPSLTNKKAARRRL